MWIKIKNKNIKGVALENKIGQQKLIYANCESKQSTALKLVKRKNSFYELQGMDIYCKNCKKHTGNTFSKQLVPFSKNIIKQKSKCTICLSEKIFILEKIFEDKYDLESKVKVYPKFFTNWSYKRKWRRIG